MELDDTEEAGVAMESVDNAADLGAEGVDLVEHGGGVNGDEDLAVQAGFDILGLVIIWEVEERRSRLGDGSCGREGGCCIRRN